METKKIWDKKKGEPKLSFQCEFLFKSDYLLCLSASIGSPSLVE